MIPSEGDALALHKKYGSDERVVRHCRIVATAAVTLAERFRMKGIDVDVESVKAGALLHDLGRSKVRTVAHGAVGAGLLEGEEVDAKVVEIVRRHVGAGIAQEEAEALGLPRSDYIPRTLEERIVCFSDKMVGSDRVRPFDDEVRRFTVKGHDVARLVALKMGLQEKLGEDPERLLLDNVKETQQTAVK